MTLDEAIEHAKDVAKEQRRKEALFEGLNPTESKEILIQSCEKCEAEHEQLADWLTELKRLREKAKGDKWYQKGREDMLNELQDNKEEMIVNALGLFIKQCGEMAEKNWANSHVEMLERLFGAVLKGCKYDEWEKGEE